MITTNLKPLNQIKLLQFWLANSTFEQEMSKIVFVPLTDEMVFEHPEMITGPITTYKPATSRKGSPSLSSKESLHVSGVDLKGDMVNGFNVVYTVHKPKKKVQG